MREDCGAGTATLSLRAGRAAVGAGGGAGCGFPALTRHQTSTPHVRKTPTAQD